MSGHDTVLTILLALMALLYASVGHAGSSGYQAAMLLMGVPAETMKTTALSLNIVVALIAWYQFWRRGWFDFRLWAILACASGPAAWLGGKLVLPPGWYYLLVAIVLWLAAIRLWWQPKAVSADSQANLRPPSVPLLLGVGLVLGFLSGLTGTGGGIFLTPLLVLARWATPGHAAGVSAAFILVNSIAGLHGWWEKNPVFPELLPVWLVLVAVCGWIGAWYGSRFGSPFLLRRLLAVVLVIAGVKIVLEQLTRS